MNKKDNFENGLRERLGGARSEPPSQVWERISATLKEQGLTAAPKPAANVHRMRRLRIGYAAAAAAVLLAAVLVFGPERTPDKVLVTENLPPVVSDYTTPDQIVTPDIPADGTTSQITIRDELTLVNNIEVVDDDGYWNHPSPVPPDVNIEFIQTADPAPVEAEGKNEPDSKPVRQWADRDEIERALKANGKNSGTNDMSVGLYSSNIGNRSSEKIVQSAPYAKATSSFVSQESVNAAFKSSTQTSTSTVLQHRVPLSAGVSVTKKLAGRFSLESGVTYSYLYSKGESSLSSGANGIKEQHLHFIGIPIGIKYDFLHSRYVDFYASASGLFEMCAYSKISTKVMVADGISGESDSRSLNVRGIQPSVGMRVGAEVKLSRRLGIYVEPGFSYYFDIEKQPESYRTENPFNFAFSAGLRVNFK